ncbi:NAD(P)/FAD-dependent oxidoreductase [Streptomyces endophytica]|uniref:NAD(P)/FAD-dependent oxidoreductase n=1 Tax=Streptomyces endophytica TaxID=2991496 RepID=UPI00311ACD79
MKKLNKIANGVTDHRPRGARPRKAASGRVVVLGGGYAGMMAALRLAPHARVTLVDPDDRLTERVRLHEVAAGRPEVAHSRAELLRGTGVEHLAARATALDPDARVVHTDRGRTLRYDRLVYALGSHTDPRGAGQRSFTAETATALHRRLLTGPGALAVVGGGLTGIEMAAELAEAHPEWQVRLLTGGELGPGLSVRGRTHVRTVLDRLHVRVTEGRRVTDADDLDADAVVWTAALRATGASPGTRASTPTRQPAASGSTPHCARSATRTSTSPVTRPRPAPCGPAPSAWPAPPPCRPAPTRPAASSPNSAAPHPGR